MEAELESQEAEEFWQDVCRELDEEALREMDDLQPQMPVAPHRPRQPQVAGAGGAVQALAVAPQEQGQQSPAGSHIQSSHTTCADEALKPLIAAARRTNMHFTHVRTHNLDHVQPSSLTRQQACKSIAPQGRVPRRDRTQMHR